MEVRSPFARRALQLHIHGDALDARARELNVIQEHGVEGKPFHGVAL